VHPRRGQFVVVVLTITRFIEKADFSCTGPSYFVVAWFTWMEFFGGFLIVD